MAFADWPLSFGSINPEGWLIYMVPFLEHSHRLLATLVGLLVLAMFSWAYVNSGRRAVEVAGVVLLLAVIFGVFIAAGAERSDDDRKSVLITVALAISILPVGWLAWSWRGRDWVLVEKLSALALLMVTTQAIFGGLRVTEISNSFAVVHGCLAQAFFCLLILIVMVSGSGWSKTGEQPSVAEMSGLRQLSAGLVFLVFIQLILGASMRHFHRHGLADHGILKTQEMWIPSFDEPIIAVMFFHKLTALSILFLVVTISVQIGRRKAAGSGGAGRMIPLMTGLVSVQVLLGISVIATGKNFWITNVHVLNGLAILAVAFVIMVRSWRASSSEAALAKP